MLQVQGRSAPAASLSLPIYLRTEKVATVKPQAPDSILVFFENMLEKLGLNKKQSCCIAAENATNVFKASEEPSGLWLLLLWPIFERGLWMKIKTSFLQLFNEGLLIAGKERKRKQAALNVPHNAL